MIKPFYIDISALVTSRRSAERNRNFVQQLLTLWNTLTGFHISNLDNLQPVIENPFERYTRLVENAKKVRDGEIIKVPAGFDDIRRLAQELRQTNLSYFSLSRGEISLSPNYYRKQVNRAFYFAATPAQQKRLKYAQNVCKLIAQQRDLYEEEMGSVRGFRWSPVPTGVRLSHFADGVRPVVDEKFVASGFDVYASFGTQRVEHEPYGDFRIAVSGDDMVLLEPGDSTPKDFETIPGHYEFVGKTLRQKEKTIFEKVTEVFS